MAGGAGKVGRDAVWAVLRETQCWLWKEQEVLQEFDRAVARLAERNAIYGDDEIAADAEAAVAEVRDTSARP